ncbi:MAG: NAD(P)-dependent oxidoreductase [Alphaproteobacteria bacterium]|nr:NAD(P)-dependent oxidoreductase [Alphaproteobacteria bacterium]
MKGLIGHTGFVGGTLLRSGQYEALFNSKNFKEMRTLHFDEIVCAGVSAVKWKANKEPEADQAAIAELQNVLSEVTADRFILISTIDVYPTLTAMDERSDLTSLDNHAYGKHRLSFESFCTAHFPKCHVVRLPGLFGEGLKKNMLYDLVHDNCLDVINPRSSFQFYDLSLLEDDIRTLVRHDIRLANLFPEPVLSADILERYFPGKNVGAKAGLEIHYNLKTVYGDLWKSGGPYRMNRNDVFKRLDLFFANECGHE